MGASFSIISAMTADGDSGCAKDRLRADVNLSGSLYKLGNRPGDVLPIVPKEL
jgi:hypothetical protein